MRWERIVVYSQECLMQLWQLDFCLYMGYGNKVIVCRSSLDAVREKKSDDKKI